MAKKYDKPRYNKYKPEYAATANKLCAMSGYTDEMLAEFFDVCASTVDKWKIKYPEFREALRVGKAETDDMVERSAVAHMKGYYVTVDEMDRFGSVKKMKKWIPGNAHAAMKWLQARRPEQYREQKEVKHALSMDDAFLQFLDKMDARAKAEKKRNAPLLEHVTIIEAEINERERTRADAEPADTDPQERNHSEDHSGVGEEVEDHGRVDRE